ncbi:MAG: hypothetical protein HQL46_16455, partial [Gammaproteobacteria bacterium]|nr:hypothetical protein [Gammaproteobacteria bacterium]
KSIMIYPFVDEVVKNKDSPGVCEQNPGLYWYYADLSVDTSKCTGIGDPKYCSCNSFNPRSYCTQTERFEKVSKAQIPKQNDKTYMSVKINKKNFSFPFTYNKVTDGKMCTLYNTTLSKKDISEIKKIYGKKKKIVTTTFHRMEVPAISATAKTTWGSTKDTDSKFICVIVPNEETDSILDYSVPKTRRGCTLSVHRTSSGTNKKICQTATVKIDGERFKTKVNECGKNYVEIIRYTTKEVLL